jgi:hypothetical protein
LHARSAGSRVLFGIVVASKAGVDGGGECCHDTSGGDAISLSIEMDIR